MGLSARFTKALDDLRASYWFVPSVLVLGTIGLAQITIAIDRNPDVLPFAMSNLASSVSVDGARQVLAVIAQSMIGVAGVMFSITMVAVAFASGQYGPRLIGNFMRDRGNQWSLGILISAFVYGLLILRSVQSPGEGEFFVPHLSVFVAMGIAMVAVYAVIYHVHHVPETINVSNIIAGLGRRFVNEVERLSSLGPAPENAPPPSVQTWVDIEMTTQGYVHSIAVRQLSDLAVENNWWIEILTPPGTFVHTRRPVLRILGPSSLSEDEQAELRRSVALGDSKTEDQNLMFIAEQLVEIVGRAMSPGINDPFTAITCMQWLQAGLVIAAEHKSGLPVFQEDRVNLAPISFGQLLNGSLGDCLPYVRPDHMARRELRDLLVRLGNGQPGTSEIQEAVEPLLAQLSIDT